MNMGTNVKTAGTALPAPPFAELGKRTKTENSGFAAAFDKVLKECRNSAKDRSKMPGAGKDRSQTVGAGKDMGQTFGAGKDMGQTFGAGKDRSQTVGAGKDRSQPPVTGRDKSQTHGAGKDRNQTPAASKDKNQTPVTDRETPEPPVKKQDSAENTAKDQKPQKAEDKKPESKDGSGQALGLQAELAMQLVDIPAPLPMEPEKAEAAEAETETITAAAIWESQPGDTQLVQLNLRTDAGSPAEQKAYTEIPQNLESSKGLVQTVASASKTASADRQPEAVETAEAAGPKIQAQQPQAEADNGTDTFSGLLKDHAERLEAMGSKKAAATEAADRADQKQENQTLEDLKRNAGGSAADLTDRLAAKQSVYKQVPVMDNAGSDPQTPALRQLRTGLEQGMKQNLQKFTIRLKPEGLGEIVVHMTSAGGRTTVSLAVSNPETEKLVNSQMMSLKEMLEPLHVEVESVYHNSQGGMAFAGSGQEMFRNQSQSRPQIRGSRGRAREQAAETDMILQETERMTAQSNLRRLYAYV